MKEGVKQEDLPQILKSNNISNYLNLVSVEKGDYIYIPAGTIHAIMGGNLICEIQQNSDITYRVYDWGRVGKDGKPRELHVEKSIDVTKVGNSPEVCKTANLQAGENNIVNSEYFRTSKIIVESEFKDKSNLETCYIMNVVEGSGEMFCNSRTYDLRLGDSFIIPSNLGEYRITGRIEILKSYI